MAFTEADRVQIRKYLGYPQIWLQADPRLESAISNIQAIADGGTRPNPSPSAAETEAKAIVTVLQGIDTQLLALAQFSGAYKADNEAEVDAAREDARLRSHGRMYVSRLAHMFDTEAQQDAFSSGSAGDDFRGGGMPRGPFGGRSGY